MSRYFVLFSLLFPAFCLTGQSTFKKRFGTNAMDWPSCVEVLPDNSFIVGGFSLGGGIGIGDAVLVKFSATGDVEWSRAYGSVGGSEDFRYILSCSDGNFLAVGHTNGFGAGATDLYVVKFDLSGNVLWERTCGGSGEDFSRGVCEVSDGYVVTGTVQGFGNGQTDAFAEKFDFAGNSVWRKAYGTSSVENGGQPWGDPNGPIWIAGSITVGTKLDASLQRINANGSVIDTKRFGTGDQNEIMDYLTPGGPGVIGSGSIWTNGQTRPGLFGFNSSGGLVWAKQYVMPTANAEYSIHAERCPNGGLVFAPYKYYLPESVGYLIKTDDSGNITWAKKYSIGNNSRMTHVRQAPDGGYVAIGIYGGLDFFILKTDAAGNVEGCCPEDVAVTVVDMSLPVTNLAYTAVDGPVALDATADNQDFDLDEADLCNGPSCCITHAGAMLEQTLHACINEPATLTHNGDEVLDNDDLLQFILFSDPNDTLGSIITISNTPTFTFNPATMQTGVTYYVAAIAGNNLGGNVDFDDPCFHISNAAELIWHPLPEVELQTDNSDVCPGGCRTLTAVLTGSPPFTLTVSSQAGIESFTFQSNTGTFEICPPPGMPPGSFTVQATTLTDAYCTCE